ncbi:MAG TPA: hypothetical protein VNJ08_11270 [Bacteriovoracaceae bacterium]|nr:hypothetical protein [Bacteriovoracaceae bacterium]
MMNIQITCGGCGSGIEMHPDLLASKVECHICKHVTELHFTPDHQQDNLKTCPVCTRQDFYKQKDFNRKIGVVLFVIAAILSIWTYGISLIVLFIVDLILFKRLGVVAICYKCNTNFRGVKNIEEIRDFDHEMNDRIVYSDHDFKGKPLSH